jgi:integrase
LAIYRIKKSRYWQFRFVVAGVEHRGSTQIEDKALALRIAAKLEADAKRGRLTLEQAADLYWSEVRQKPGHQRDVLYQLGNLQRLIGRNKMLDELSDDVISVFADRRRREPKRHTANGQLASATVNREIELLRRILNRAQKVWNVSVGILPDWVNLKLPEAEPRSRNASQDELARLFEAIGKTRPELLAPVQFSISSGVRLMRTMGMKWDQINFSTGFIEFYPPDRPAPTSDRVQLTDRLRDILEGEVGKHPEFVFTFDSRHATRKGRFPFTKTGWRKDWKKILAEAHIIDFRWQDFRHMAVLIARDAEAIKNGMDKMGENWAGRSRRSCGVNRFGR